MIFRLSQAIAKKIKHSPTICVPADPNPFADWSGDLFTADRAQYILVTNTVSLYSVLMHGAGITGDDRFLDAALSEMREFMLAGGHEFIFRRFVAPATKEVRFSKPLNRSVVASINQQIYHAKLHLGEEGLSPYEAAERINARPLAIIGHRSPSQAFPSMWVEQPRTEASGKEHGS